ncbi:MAG: hypothetical protein IKY26_02835 [Erysipelotrichaceae bacterium]|nr:hypothetical protein [Erysipelotrichaceae bacterium]
MANFKVPDIPSTYQFVLSDFLGVDYNDTVIDNRRSPKMVNFVNNNGFLETRYGHKILLNVDNAPINGVWNIDANNDIFVVHCGTNLYEVSSDFKEKVLIRSGLADTKSTGLYLNGKLLILDGVRALVYSKVGDDWIVQNLDEIGYIPKTAIGRGPNGVPTTKYEAPNLCSPYRINDFLSDGTSSVYQLDGESWDIETPIVTQLLPDGTIGTITNFMFDSTTGKITFAEPPAKSPVDGRDNIFVRFKSKDMVCYINKCKFGVLYGYGGNNNRAFVSGNSDFKNVDWYSEINDMTYFSADDYGVVGVDPIVGYSRTVSGQLVIHKKLSDTDCTVYYRDYNSSNQKQIFPLSSGVKNIGCLTPHCCVNFMNDSLFLSELGVFGLVNNSNNNNEKFAEERSYYIKPSLLNEERLENAIAIVNGFRYYLYVNGKVYMADKRFLGSQSLSTSEYQYEWFVFDNMDVTTFFNWNTKLYWGDSKGNIRTFGDDHIDELRIEDDEIITEPVKPYWESTFLYFNNYRLAKTVRRIFVHHSPIGKTKINVYSITPDGTSLVTTSEYDAVEDNFPKVIQEKEKISKVMCCKIAIGNDDECRCSFSNIIMEYRLGGKYRGE